MNKTLKIRRVGNSLGAILPKDITEALHVEEGDELYVISTPDGIKLTPYDPDFAEAMEGAGQFMDVHRNALKKLAE